MRPESSSTAPSVHPACAAFPMMSAEALEGLAADVKLNGLLEPAVVHGGQLLDGRNRLRACAMAGVEPRTVEWDGDGDPTPWVVSKNLHRRHLTESQRAMVGARLLEGFAAEARERQGARTDISADLRGSSEPRKAASDAASAVNVSTRSVENASRVLRDGVPELADLIEAGSLSASGAAELTRQPEPDQRRAAEMIRDGEAKNARQAARRVQDERRAEASRDAPEVAGSEIVCRDAVEHLRGLSSAPALFVFDPPYGLDTHNTRRGGQDYADGEDYALSLLDDVVRAIAEKGEAGAHVYVFSGYTHVHAFKSVLARHLDVQDNPLVWIKENHTMCDFSRKYASRHEYVLFARVKGGDRLLADMHSDVLEYARQRDTTHSAEKPVDLIRFLIRQSSTAGELVCDPFVGSGAAAAAAHLEGRAFTGCDEKQEWVEVSRGRIAGL